jgi:hypothetical protein
MIYLAPALVAAPYSVNANSPRIGYHNIVTADNLAADEEEVGYPVTNLANPATYPRAAWRGTSTAEQYVTVVQAATDVDYFGIARHNLGSTGASVQLQGSDNGSDWDDVSIEVNPGQDWVLMLHFTPVSYAQWRLRIVPGTAAPEIAVFYLGTLLTLQRNIYVGHTPLVYGRNKSVVTGKSESGQFMGRTTRREFLQSAVDLKNLTPAWFRSHLDPFLDECQAGKPYFWAWRPGSYPAEVGYAWIEGTPSISNQSPNGLMQAGWSMQGIR